MANKKAFYFPFVHVNEYVEISKESISDSGFNVLNFKQLFNIKNIFDRKNNVAVLNLYEDRLYQKRFGKLRAFIEHFVVFFQLILMRLFASHIIWVRHNFKPHNRAQRPFTHKLTCGALNLLATKIVTLEKTESFNSTVIPHPLYRNDDEMLHDISRVEPETFEVEYLFFGTIKPYKRLDELLTLWPQDTFLKIVGDCQDKAYVEKIKAIISDKNLNVDWQNEYVSEQYLNQLLAKTRFVFMPHSDGAMISSGTFYQAINFGINIVCFDSFYARDKKAKHDFIHIVAKDNLEADLLKLVPVPPEVVVREALDWYGRKTIAQAWNNLLP
jgi:beta-1,4-mannosyltransferase